MMSNSHSEAVRRAVTTYDGHWRANRERVMRIIFASLTPDQRRVLASVLDDECDVLASIIDPEALAGHEIVLALQEVNSDGPHFLAYTTDGPHIVESPTPYDALMSLLSLVWSVEAEDETHAEPDDIDDDLPFPLPFN